MALLQLFRKLYKKQFIEKEDRSDMQNKPLISILVPVYNTSLYLRECLDSLISQTISDIEIVCVNDGSTDNSLEILKEYQEKDKRIRIVDKVNGGLPTARNSGLDNALGEYIGFVDSDDYVSKNMYETMYQAAIKNVSDIVICGAEIFPSMPKAADWLYDVLSPNDITYKTFSKQLLFQEKGVKPFLWRYLIKRNLIEENHIRFQEDIIIGEDLAFQFKILPKAKGVTLLSDKLYHYRWYRSGSIMNSSVYVNDNSKVIAHIKMIVSITNELVDSGEIHLFLKEYMGWCLPFIYEDYISLPQPLKVSSAKLLTKSWSQAGFNYYSSDLCQIHKDMAVYIYDMAKEEEIIPELSIIVPINNSYNFICDCLDSVINISKKDIEILLINNGTNDNTYDYIYKYLVKDKRVRLINQAWKPLADVLNLGINKANADFITFIKPIDSYCSSDEINNIIEQMKKYSLNVGGYHDSAKDGIYDVYMCQNLDYYQFIYNKKSIIDNKILFKDYSFLTGAVFFTEYMVTQKKVYLISRKFYSKNSILRRQRIYTEEANLILKGFLVLLEYAQRFSLYELKENIALALNSENFFNLIISSTLPYKVDNEKGDEKNSQGLILKSLLNINMLLGTNTDKTKKSILRTLYGFVQERHKFLANND
jgi:glycosyltransferase involved in cell wall biosynthesis